MSLACGSLLILTHGEREKGEERAGGEGEREREGEKKGEDGRRAEDKPLV